MCYEYLTLRIVATKTIAKQFFFNQHKKLGFLINHVVLRSVKTLIFERRACMVIGTEHMKKLK